MRKDIRAEIQERGRLLCLGGCIPTRFGVNECLIGHAALASLRRSRLFDHARQHCSHLHGLDFTSPCSGYTFHNAFSLRSLSSLDYQTIKTSKPPCARAELLRVPLKERSTVETVHTLQPQHQRDRLLRITAKTTWEDIGDHHRPQHDSRFLPSFGI